MSVKIGHAVMDEKGGSRDGMPGDQTGREVRVQDWYRRTGGWTVYLEPLDAAMGARAADRMTAICENNNIGYNQEKRSTARKAVLIAGSIEAAGPSDVDCSSGVDLAYEMAGLTVERGYTGNLERRYLATGKFRAYRDALHLDTADHAKRGGLYLTPGNHVAMVLTDGPKAGQASGTTNASSEADDITPPYVLVLGGTVNVRSGPSTDHGILFVATKGTRLPYIETDDDTGWYGVETHMGAAFISCRGDLTVLILREVQQ